MTVPLPLHKHYTAEGAITCHVADCDVYRIQRAQRERVPLPRYAPSIIYACPECWGDLQHEGGSDYWCAACHRSFYFSEIGLYDDGDLDD